MRVAEARTASGGDQLPLGACVAAFDRGVGRRHASGMNAIVVSGESLRRGRSGRLNRALEALTIASGEKNGN